MREGLVVEGIVHNGLVDGGTGDAREGCEGAVGKMATIPKIDRGSITVVRNKHTVIDANEGKGVEVGSRMNEGRTDSQEAEVEGPKVRQGWANMPKGTSTNQGTVGEGSPIEGDDQATDPSH